MTLHRGSVVASDALRAMRAEAIDILCKVSIVLPALRMRKRRSASFSCRQAMTTSTGYSISCLLMCSTTVARVVDFFSDLAGTDDYEIIQSIEHRLLWMHRRNKEFELAKTRCRGSCRRRSVA